MGSLRELIVLGIDVSRAAVAKYIGRRDFLSLERSCHGNTVGGLSIGATDNREQIKNLLPHCGKVAPPISINLGVLIPEKDARDVDGGERQGFLLDLRLAPAQRRRGDRGPARSQGEPGNDKCRRNGLLVSTEGSTVLLLPSLAIDKRTAARGLDILRARYDAPRDLPQNLESSLLVKVCAGFLRFGRQASTSPIASTTRTPLTVHIVVVSGISE